jgi:hypothetical protein
MKLLERVRIAFNVLVGKSTGAPIPNLTNPERQPMQRVTRGQRSWGVSREGRDDHKQNSPTKSVNRFLQEHRSEACSESNRHGAPIEGRTR